jgi:prepilin-type processing-associated H-X9-DG protein
MAISPTWIYPEYLSDSAVYICPSDSAAVSPSETRDRLRKIYSTPGVTPKDIYDGLLCVLGPTSYAYTGWVALRDIAYCTHFGCPDGEINVIMQAPSAIVTNVLSPGTWPGLPDNTDADADVPWSWFTALGDAGQKCWGSGPTSTSYRLREGIERFMITDINNAAGSAIAQSEVPVMFDMVSSSLNGAQPEGNMARFNHIPGGMNCLFMDGHVEFLRYGTRFPCSPEAASSIGNRYAYFYQGEDLWLQYAVRPNGPF